MIIPLKIYNPGKPEDAKKPRPLLKLGDDGNVHVVDDDGRTIAVLYGYSKRLLTIAAFSLAKSVIEDRGFDTSWAEWDKEGRFVRWAE